MSSQDTEPFSLTYIFFLLDQPVHRCPSSRLIPYGLVVHSDAVDGFSSGIHIVKALLVRIKYAQILPSVPSGSADYLPAADAAKVHRSLDIPSWFRPPSVS